MMSRSQTCILLTRPREASEAFWQSCAGILPSDTCVLISPLLEIVGTGRKPDLDGFKGVIFTSSNGVKFSGKPQALPAYCVGEATTQEALKSGWDAQMCGDGSKELIDTLKQRKPGFPLLHIGGVYRRGSVAQNLTNAGVLTEEIDVYDQELLNLSTEANKVLRGDLPVIVPLFSPRTARQFADTVRINAPLHLIALSEAISNEVTDVSAQTLTVLKRANAKTMIDTLRNVLHRVETGASAP